MSEQDTRTDIFTILGIAILDDDEETFDDHVSKIDINQANNQSDTLLHIATYTRNLKYVEKIIRDHSPDLNRRNRLGQTPLHIMAIFGMFECLDLAIRYGADPTLLCDSGMSVLHYAISVNRKAPTVSQQTLDELILAKTIFLEYILEKDSVISKLLNKSDNGSGNTPLHWALLMREPQMVNLLLGAGADTNAFNRNKDAPLHFAALTNNILAAAFLIDEGAKLDAKNSDGATPLDVAVAYNHSEITNFLVNMGAELSASGYMPNKRIH